MSQQETVIGAPSNNSEPIYINVYDVNNKPRLWVAKQSLSEILSSFNESDYSQLVNGIKVAYNVWRDFSEYIVLRNIETGKTIGIKASKRGNDIYEWKLRKKLWNLIEFVENHDIVWFDYKNDRVVYSEMIFVTLTYKHDNFIEDWKNAGVEFNRFMSRIRKKWGYVKVLARSFQAHRDGYIHIHALLYFGYPIYGSRHINEKGEITFRIDVGLSDLKKCWDQGFSDWQLVDKLSSGLKYIMRYMLKENDNSEYKELTYSLSWIFHKREFAINYKLLYKLLFEKNLSQFNDKNRLDYPKTNSNRATPEKSAWVFVGLFVLVGVKDWFIEWNSLLYLAKF